MAFVSTSTHGLSADDSSGHFVGHGGDFGGGGAAGDFAGDGGAGDGGGGDGGGGGD